MTRSAGIRGLRSALCGLTGGKNARWLVLALVAATLGLGSVVPTVASNAVQRLRNEVPDTLAETGLYSDSSRLAVDPRHLEFSPQYPLWTDGAAKRRWISLPRGAAIDASNPDAWVFPVGTRFWKEFSFAGRRIETRYMELRDNGEWSYATYAWSQDGREASLVPDRGRRAAYQLTAGSSHTIPGVTDCKVCHKGGRSEILGFSTLQLSPDRDPHAVHGETRPHSAVDLASLVAAGLVTGLPTSLQRQPPKIEARSSTERAALGYMHANCGHCHNDHGPMRSLGLSLRHELGAPVQPALSSTVGQPVKKPAPGQSQEATLRIDPQRPHRSALVERMASRYPPLQMPPLGTALVDDEAVTVLRRWIAETVQASDETQEEK